MSNFQFKFGRNYDKHGPVKQAEDWMDYSTNRIASNGKVARPRSGAWKRTKFPEQRSGKKSLEEPSEELRPLSSVEEWSEMHPKSLHPGFLNYKQQNLWLHAVLCLNEIQKELADFNKPHFTGEYMKIPIDALAVFKTAGDKFEGMRNGGWWKNGVHLGIAPIRGVFLEIRHDAKMHRLKRSEQADTPLLIHKFWPLLYTPLKDVDSIRYDSE